MDNPSLVEGGLDSGHVWQAIVSHGRETFCHEVVDADGKTKHGIPCDQGEGMLGLEGHTTVSCAGHLVVYGGRTDPLRFNAHVYVLDLARSVWKRLTTRGFEGQNTCNEGVFPSARAYHTSAMHQQRMIVFGGLLAIGVEDVHYNAYNVRVHTELVSTPGNNRMLPSTALPPFTQRQQESSYYYELDLTGEATWRAPETFGDVPPTRSHHTACVTDHCMLIYGGYSVHTSGSKGDSELNLLANVSILNLDTMMWRCVRTRSSWGPHVWGHTAWIADGVMWLWGGIDRVTGLDSDSLVGYHIKSEEWREWVPQDRDVECFPPSRAQHVAAPLPGHRIMIHGGTAGVCTSDVIRRDTHVLSLITGTWMQLLHFCGDVQPEPVCSHTATLVGATVYIFGGLHSTCHRSNEVWAYRDDVAPQWALVPARYDPTSHYQNPIRRLENDFYNVAQKMEVLRTVREQDRQRCAAYEEAVQKARPAMTLERPSHNASHCTVSKPLPLPPTGSVFNSFPSSSCADIFSKEWNFLHRLPPETQKALKQAEERIASSRRENVKVRCTGLITPYAPTFQHWKEPILPLPSNVPLVTASSQCRRNGARTRLGRLCFDYDDTTGVNCDRVWDAVEMDLVDRSRLRNAIYETEQRLHHSLESVDENCGGAVMKQVTGKTMEHAELQTAPRTCEGKVERRQHSPVPSKIENVDVQPRAAMFAHYGDVVRPFMPPAEYAGLVDRWYGGVTSPTLHRSSSQASKSGPSRQKYYVSPSIRKLGLDKYLTHQSQR